MYKRRRPLWNAITAAAAVVVNFTAFHCAEAFVSTPASGTTVVTNTTTRWDASLHLRTTATCRTAFVAPSRTATTSPRGWILSPQQVISSRSSVAAVDAVPGFLLGTIPVTTGTRIRHQLFSVNDHGARRVDVDVARRGQASPAPRSVTARGFSVVEGEDGIMKKENLGRKRRGSGGGGSGSGSGDNHSVGHGVRTLVDLVQLLHESEDPVWDLLRFEGGEASKQSHVSSMIQGSVLARASLEDAVSCDVANKMATTFLSATELHSLVCEMFSDEPSLGSVVAEDLLAHAMRDASLPDALTALLFHKGFTALTAYRLMHWLWRGERRSMARYLQSICSELCAADIHPASTIGKGVFMAAGCDVVIGETAVVGDDVCLLQGVTLGGTGRESGDRHPKVASGCYIGASSSILGNIPIGEGSRIEAASVVVKPIAPYSINRGVPSKCVAYVVCDPYQDMGGGGGMESREQTDDQVNNRTETSAGEPRQMFTNHASHYIGV